MTEREAMEAGMAGIAGYAKQVAEEACGEPVEVGWKRQAAAREGVHSPMYGDGAILTFRVGNESDEAGAKGFACCVVPGATGAVLAMPKALRDTGWCCWRDTDHPAVPYARKIHALRFCIGGDGTPGSGFLVRVVLDPDVGALRLSLPEDPRALDWILFY